MDFERTFGNAVGLICTQNYSKEEPIEDHVFQAAGAGLGFGLWAGCEDTDEKYQLLVSYKNDYEDADKMIRYMVSLFEVYCKPEMQEALLKVSEEDGTTPLLMTTLKLVTLYRENFGEITEEHRQFHFSKVVVFSLLFGLTLSVEHPEIAKMLLKYAD